MNAENMSSVYHVEAETRFEVKVDKFSFGWTVSNLKLLTRSHRSPLFHAQEAKVKWALNLTPRSDCVIVDIIVVESEEKNYAVKYELHAYNSRKVLIKSLLRQADINKASINPIDCLSICREELNKINEDRLRLMCIMEVSSLEAIEKCDTPGASSGSVVTSHAPSLSTVQQAEAKSEFVGTLSPAVPSPSTLQQAVTKSEFVGFQSPAVPSPSTVQQAGSWSDFLSTLRTAVASPPTVQQTGAKNEFVGTESPAVISPSTLQQDVAKSEFVSTQSPAVQSPSTVQQAKSWSEFVGTLSTPVSSPSTVQQAEAKSEPMGSQSPAVLNPSTVGQAEAKSESVGSQSPAVPNPSTVQPTGAWSEFLSTLKTAVPNPSPVQQVSTDVPPIEESSIVTFSVNGTLFEADRAKIATNCPSLIKSGKEHIKIDLRPEIFEQLLNFILTKEVNITEFAADLLPPAANYEFQELKDLCDEALCSNITEENCIELVVMADLYSAPKLKKRTLSFIAANASNLTDKPEWNKLKSSHKSLFDQVVFSIINCM